MKNFLALCSYPALRKWPHCTRIASLLGESKILEGRDCDLVIFTSLEPNTALGIGAQTIFVE